MRLLTLEQDAPYLAARGDDTGTFIQWLDTLKVSRASNLTIANIVKYGWVRPTCRVAIPDRYLIAWKDYPVLSSDWEFHDDDVWADRLWHSAGSSHGYTFWEKSLRGEWFVHPFDRPWSPLAKIIARARRSEQLAPGIAKSHPNGRQYFPWIDYFPHWKGYELIDVLRVAKLIGGVWCTDDTEAILRGLLRDHDKLRKFCLPWIERAKRDWQARSIFFEPLSRYRAMRSALSASRSPMRRKPPKRAWSIRDAGRALAKRLSVTPDLLEQHALPDLLELATEWQSWKDKDGIGPGKHAWGQLQKDIICTVEWLYSMTGNTIEHYYDVWDDRAPRARNVLALEKVLPQEFRTAESFFLDHFLVVRGSYDKLPAHVRLTDAEVTELVKALRRKTLLATDWLTNYQRLHKALSGPPEWDWAGVTESSIMHDFTLFALFAEKILEALGQKIGLDVKPLVGEFCRELEAKDPRFGGSWQLAASHWKSCTDLRAKPSDPFGHIMRLPLGVPPERAELARALLLFGLTRNYFGHHSYLDSQLVQTAEGGAAVGAVITATLYLTAVPCGIR